ncbi:hypothetical protein [Streptomyces vinaceus]
MDDVKLPSRLLTEPLGAGLSCARAREPLAPSWQAWTCPQRAWTTY